MDIQEIMKLIQAVSDHGLSSFELEEGNVRISLKREKEMVQVQTPVLAATLPVGTVPGAVPGTPLAAGAIAGGLTGAVLPGAAGGLAVSGALASDNAADTKEGTESEGIDADQVVTSPLVGVFYAASSPDADPYVKVGDRVRKGQVLGIIEAMKLMNEIESEYDGVVEAILVENEAVVEYGQPLFRIR